MHHVLNTLYERAKGNMTAEELDDVGHKLTDDATTLALQMSSVAGGLAVMADAERDTGTIVAVLYALSVQFDTIASMIDVGSEATFKAGELKKAATAKA